MGRAHEREEGRDGGRDWCMNGEEEEKKRGKTQSMGEVVRVEYEKRESEQKQEQRGGEYLSLHFDVCDGR